VSNLAQPYVQHLPAYIPGGRRRDPDDVLLASNENALGPSAEVLEALHALLSSREPDSPGCCPALARYPDSGCGELAGKLAERLGVTPDCLVFGHGSDELLRLIAQTYLSPEDEVIYGQPSFPVYAMDAQLIVGPERCRAVPLRDYRLDLEAMAERITPRTKLIFIANPNTPTGTIVTAAEVTSFLSVLPEQALTVLDEAYYEYVTDPDYPASLDYVRAGQNVLVLRTFSKGYALAGLRIGYAVARPELIEDLHRVRDPYNVSQLAQAAALACLEALGQEEASREFNEAGKQYLYRELERLGVKFVPTQSNFLLIHLEQDDLRVCEALRGRGVIVRPGTNLGLPQHLRVTIGTAAQNQRFIEALEVVLEPHQEPIRRVGVIASVAKQSPPEEIASSLRSSQ
jgi:histidinol-phosphate aminotransferase